VGRKTSARSTRPSSMVIGTSQSIRMPSRISVRWRSEVIMSSHILSDGVSRLRHLRSLFWEATKTTTPGTRVEPGWQGRSRMPAGAKNLACGASAPLDLGHLLQNRADCRRVAAAKSAFHRLKVDAFGGIKNRRRYADPACVVANHLHVLVPHRNLHCDVVVTALCHHRCAQLEDAGVPGPGRNQIDDHFRIESRLHAEHHSFGGGDVIDSDQ